MLRSYTRGMLTLALLLALTGSSGAAAAGKGAGAQRGKGVEQMSERGRANTNAQWSADPDRGWVRAEERHRLHEKTQAPVKHNHGQSKAKGKLPRS